MSNTMQGPPADDLAAPPEESSGGNQRRILMAVVAVAGVLVLGAAVYFLFLSGGGTESLAPITPGTPPASGSAGSTASPATTAPANYQHSVGRDPFQLLAAEAPVVAPVVGGTSGVPTDPGTGGGGNPGGGGVPSDTATAPAPTPTTSTTDPGPVTQYVVIVKSVDVGKGTATFSVNGNKYTVGLKDNFPNSSTGPFELVRVGQLPSGKDTATIVFGSDSPTEMKVGEKQTFHV